MLKGILKDVISIVVDCFSFLCENEGAKNDNQKLIERWERELYYADSDKIRRLLKERNLYYYNLDVDGRVNCVNALIRDLVSNNIKPI